MQRLLLPLLLAGLTGCAVPNSIQLRGGSEVDKVLDAAMQSNMPDVALRIASEQIGRNPNDTNALLRQGDAYRAMGRMAAAEASYAKAVSSNPGDPNAQRAMATVLLARDPAAAEAGFRRALAADKSNPAALTGLGVAEDLQGRHQDAQSAYRAALAREPGMRAAQVDLGLSLALIGQTDEAIILLQPVASEPQATRRERDDLALALAAAGRGDEAKRILNEELSDDQANQALSAYRQLF